MCNEFLITPVKGMAKIRVEKEEFSSASESNCNIVLKRRNSLFNSFYFVLLFFR